MEFYIKTLDFLERVMNGVMAIDPGQQPFISRDLEELNEMRDSLLKASGQAECSNEAKAALPLQDVSGSLPSDEEFETALEKEAFRVPYDGSNNFYDETTIKHWRKCWEWVKNAVSNDR